MMSLEEISKLNLIYTRCYCEENIWKLCEDVKKSLNSILDNCFTVFISNDLEMIPLWCQKASTGDYIVWDYHVIFIHRKSRLESLVYDFDTTLEFPCNFNSYVTHCIKDEENMNYKYHRYFRVIKAQDYLSNFASDRRHMRNEDGSWKMPPPEYSPISTPQSVNNIRSFISMRPGQPFGAVMNLKEFVAFFSVDCTLRDST